MIIAIDGPSGSGKSTLGRMLARALNLLYIDTGSMYRAVALATIEAGINPEDTEAVTLLGRALKKDGPRPGDPRGEGRERLKTSYEEAAYRQLQAELQSKK